MSARTTALAALIACRKQGAWADGVLKEYIARDRLDRRDAALASRLCYGVLQNRMLLDYYIEQFLTGNIRKLQPVVLDILRLGMYQLFFLDKVPVSAAVNEAVEQGKKYANRSASGLINGVLRHAARQRDTVAPPTDLSVRYSHPEELVNLLCDSVGNERLEALLESHNRISPTIIQVNTLISSDDEVCAILRENGASVENHPWLDHAFVISGYGNLERMDAFRNGSFYVQDPAARLAVIAAGLQPEMMVLDGCSAPGGKSFAAAVAMQNRGKIISCDIHPHKIDLLAKGAERLKISIMEPMLQDASIFIPDWECKMDAVIADVPCSGLGVIRKKPDIRYKSLSELQRLPEIQLRILNNLCRYVRPGGVLLYSTCTILKRENEELISQFLHAHSEFSLEKFPLPESLPAENLGMLTLLPSIHDTDGFFICKLRRSL